eukprot:m.234090 g.234090  ORF g.234090 m.234090 type:complete len:218 (-) comp13912_c0_seq9:279-932(-)
MALRLVASRFMRASTAMAPLTATRALQTSAPRQDLLMSKTGQTGAAVLTAGMAAYLVSQEVIILHNETVVVAALGAVTYGLIKNVGGSIGAQLDERAQNIYNAINAGKNARIAALEAEIENQKAVKASFEGIADFFDAVRTYEDVKRELAFREEKLNVYNDAVTALDRMVSVEASVRAKEQAEIVNWLMAEIPKSLVGKEDAILENCITELDAMSKQ